MKIILIYFILMLVIMTNAFAQEGKMMFQKIGLNNINRAVQLQAAKAQNVYDWSMPLVIAGLTRNTEAFKTFNQRFLTAMKKEPSGPFKFWMQGRLLVSQAYMCSSQATQTATLLEQALKQQQKPQGYDKTAVFSAWALGYLESYYAQFDREQYQQLEPLLQQAIAHQQHYFYDSHATEKPGFDDMMWTYTLAMQADSLAENKPAFTELQSSMGKLVGGSALDAVKTLSSNKAAYPAWLTSILYTSAKRLSGTNPTQQPFVDGLRAQFNAMQRKKGAAALLPIDQALGVTTWAHADFDSYCPLDMHSNSCP